MKGENMEKLERVAKLLFDKGSFKSLLAARTQLFGDFPKGYPSQKWVDAVLSADDEGRLEVCTWDKKTGNYNGAWRP